MNFFLKDETPRNDGNPMHSRARRVRRSWPVSAKLAVGTMIVLNGALGVFIVKTELRKSAPAETPASATLNVPRDLTPRPDQAPAPAPAVVSVPAPATETANPTPSNPARHLQKARSSITTEHSPQAPPVAPPVRPAVSQGNETEGQHPTPAHDLASVPAANYPPPAVKTGTSAGETHANAVPKKAPQKLVSRVAPVNLPGIDKGWQPKMAVGPVEPKIEIIPRPPAEKPENCGGDEKYIPCPSLHTRP